ncbi:MAG TPA: hypothetical protein VM056_02830 [Terriglobales bacterium]|nr:hypothetical protein [Terriglobales bacterium]
MTQITTLIHATAPTENLGRTLETLRAADEVIVVNHGSDEAVTKVARQYGARMIEGVPGVDQGAYAVNCKHDWIFCLLPNETLSEALEASLLEWKATEPDATKSFAVKVREEKDGRWKNLGAETRLVNRGTVNWKEATPPPMDGAAELAGDILRFVDVKSGPE